MKKFPMFLMMFFSANFSLIFATNYEMDFRCSTFLDDGNELSAQGIINLETLAGSLTTTLMDPNDFSGRAKFSIEIVTNAENAKFVESSRGPHYFINQKVERAGLDFSLKIPSKLKDQMGILFLDGQSYEVYCDKTIRQVIDYGANSYTEENPTN